MKSSVPACSRLLHWRCHLRFRRPRGPTSAPSIPCRRSRRRPGLPPGPDVAIDGGYIIVLAFNEGSQKRPALPAQRQQWPMGLSARVVDVFGPYVRFDVAMRNGIAAVQFGDEIRLFEQSSGDYVRASSTAPIRHQGGLAISGKRVLIGGNDCDYDAVIYQKNAAGSWAITGRIDDNQGECLGAYDLAAVELQLRLRGARTPATGARRTPGGAMAPRSHWVPRGHPRLAAERGYVYEEASRCRARLPSARTAIVWLRTGTSTWTRQGRLASVDRDDGNGTHLRRRVPQWRAHSRQSASVPEPVAAVSTSKRHPATSSMSASLRAYPAQYPNTTSPTHRGGHRQRRVGNIRGAGVHAALADARSRAGGE